MSNQTGSSLPLRGIETVLERLAALLGASGPHCPYEGLKHDPVLLEQELTDVLIAPTRD